MDRLLPGLMRGVIGAAVSAPLARMIASGRRDGVDAALDEQIAAVLELQRMLRYRAVDTMDPPHARRFAEEGLSPLEVAHAPMAQVIDTMICGRADRQAAPIPVRIYVPHGAGPHWIVYLHGGGGVIGSIRSSEPVTRLLAAQTRCTVASVEYRLAPEHPHPAAIEDACAAWQALVARVPAGGKVAVAGDSFGGFLATHVDRHAGLHAIRRPDLQVLFYPIADMTLSSPAIDRFADGYLLTRSMVHWFRDLYFRPDADLHGTSPAFWADLAGAAPAIVVTAGYDPLIEDGDAYAERIRAAGVPVRHRRHASLVHGFLSLAGVVRAARAAVDETCTDIIEHLASA